MPDDREKARQRATSRPPASGVTSRTQPAGSGSPEPRLLEEEEPADRNDSELPLSAVPGTLIPSAPVVEGPETPAELAGSAVRTIDLPGGSDELGETALRLARSDVTVTLYGETGTGKDRLARSLHVHSERADKPFVVFDCGAVVASLAESELFGHEKGSFTGAITSHAGAFERAHEGTLFLDEIGELPIELQPRLLRVLETRQVRRVGGSTTRRVDFRVISATNRNLAKEVMAGRFRPDLYYRLAMATLEIPPLRARLGELPKLVKSLLDDLGYQQVQVSPKAFDVLRRRAWLGNVRELKNVLSCSVAFVDQDILEPEHLTFALGTAEQPILERLDLGGVKLQDLEREAIVQTLSQTQGNKVRAAERLGIAISTLYEKLKRYKIG